MKNWKAKYTALSTTEKGMIVMIVLLILLILTRFETISDQVKKGFNFFSQSKETVQTPKQ